MKIYVVGSSKNKFFPLDDIREKFLVDIPHQGQNIDHLNPWYCELTGLYYMWQHADDAIVGLEHYRRHFVNNAGSILNKSMVSQILTSHDCIAFKYNGDNAIKLSRNKQTAFMAYLAVLFKHDLPFYKFYRDYIHRTYMYQGNMFICNRDLLNDYCTWIFNILSKFDTLFKFGMGRIDGYMAEYTLGAWLEYKNLKIHPCNIRRYTKTLDRIENT